MAVGLWNETPLAYRTVTVSVIDAESGAPLADVTVYAHYDGWVRPESHSGTTDARGHVRLRLARRGELHASSSTHLDSPYHEQRSFDGPPRRITLALFCAPDSQVQLVIPNGYRGVFRIDEIGHLRQPDFPPRFPAGQRVFDVPAERDGVVRFTGLVPMLDGTRGTTMVTMARFENGQWIPVLRDPNPAFGLHLIGREKLISTFYVGTGTEARHVARQMADDAQYNPDAFMPRDDLR